MVLAHRHHLLPAIACLFLVLPLVTFAQEYDTMPPAAIPEMRGGPDFLPQLAPDIGQARTLVWDVLTDDYERHAVLDSYVAALNQPLIQQVKDIPIILSGVVQMHGRDTLYIGIDPEYYEEYGAKALRRELERRFPSVPVHIEPTEGVSRLQGSVPGVLPTPPISQRTSSNTSDDLVFIDNEQFVIADNTRQMQEAGTITVPGAEVVESVSVAVDIKHTYVSDLRVELVSPTGISVVLFDGPAGPDDNSDNLVASWDFPDLFQGLPASGTWRLLIGDYVVNDSGVLRSWQLTITPTGQSIQAPSLPNEGDVSEHFFFDDFEDGLSGWKVQADPKDTGWRATTFDERDTIIGTERSNIVAQSDECDKICILTLHPPLDLTGHRAMTLSFDRWVDDGLERGEYLSVEVISDGVYRQLARWSPENGGSDGRWHHEVYELTRDDLSASSFTIQFISKNSTRLEEVAIDNVMLTPSRPSVIPDEPGGPPYVGCFRSPERDVPMGGDVILSRSIDRFPHMLVCGTLTLAGIETVDEKEGAIISAHVVSSDYQYDDALIGHVYDPSVDYRIRRPIGRVRAMPFIWRGDLFGSLLPNSLITADAAFIEYPQNDVCLLPWFSDGIDYCFQREYHDLAASMQIRGRGDEVYTVTGSQLPLPGTAVMMTGAVTGPSAAGQVVHQLLNIGDWGGDHYVYTALWDQPAQEGDSGAPVYTVPDQHGDVSIVGILIGYVTYAGKRYQVFNSWDTVTEALQLKSL